jgi:exopolysaccharide production protein ExoZ
MQRAAAADRRLMGVQALRGLAACGVVLCHMAPFETKYLAGASVVPAACQYGMAGVDMYFVLSGFIITAMCAGRFRRRGEAGRFLKRRFLRIYPTYWVWAAAVLAVFLIHPGMVNSSHGRPDILQSVLLLPQQNLPLLLVAWTLVYEVFFYVVFAAALHWLRESYLPGALAVWAAIVVVGQLLLTPTNAQPWLHMFVSPLLLEFIMGCAVALYVDRCNKTAAILSLTLGTAGFVAGTFVLLMLVGPFPYGWGRVLVYGTASALVIAGLVALERQGGRWNSRPLARLGDASYSLYLSHVPVIAVTGLIWRHLLDTQSAVMRAPVMHVVVLACTFAVAVAGGIASFHLIEAPLLRILRDRPIRFVLPRPAALAAVRIMRPRHDPR